MLTAFEYVLPVVRGIQGGDEYYTSMCPLRFLPKLFPVGMGESDPVLRVGRSPSRSRIRSLCRYILDNLDSYILPALMVAIDGDTRFEPVSEEGEDWKMGRLYVPMDATLTINDGWHRRMALEWALQEHPELGYETIAVCFFLAMGLERSQQMFYDLNCHSIALDPGLGWLYNHRQWGNRWVLEVVRNVRNLRELTDLERSRLGAKSGKLFTLSMVYPAIQHMLDRGVTVAQAVLFWRGIGEVIPVWRSVLTGELRAWEVRGDSVCCQAIAFWGLAEVGVTLLSLYPESWKIYLQSLAAVDWSVANPVWQDSIMIKGRFPVSATTRVWMRDYLMGFLET